MATPFEQLAGNYGAILADPPWRFRTWDKRKAILSSNATRENLDALLAGNGLATTHYTTMDIEEICALPVGDLAAKDCALFLWVSWPQLEDAIRVIKAWGFTYKTAGFVWTKAHAGQL